MKNIAKDNRSATGNTPTLPARWYHDPEIYEAERGAIFFDEWLLFGHESRVTEPGAYHAQNIAGWPVLVIRGKDGVLRGFHNVCRHRASQVLRDGCGKAGVLRCLYHGWVYDDQGNLRKTPGFGGDEEALCGNTSLFPVHVKIWNSLIFICMKEGAPPSFEKSLGALPQAVKSINFSEFHFFDGASHRVNCNWKAYMENYL
jgi:choline monooxygenase